MSYCKNFIIQIIVAVIAGSISPSWLAIDNNPLKKNNNTQDIGTLYDGLISIKCGNSFFNEYSVARLIFYSNNCKK